MCLPRAEDEQFFPVSARLGIPRAESCPERAHTFAGSFASRGTSSTEPASCHHSVWLSTGPATAQTLAAKADVRLPNILRSELAGFMGFKGSLSVVVGKAEESLHHQVEFPLTQLTEALNQDCGISLSELLGFVP